MALRRRPFTASAELEVDGFEMSREGIWIGKRAEATSAEPAFRINCFLFMTNMSLSEIKRGGNWCHPFNYFIETKEC